MLQLLLDENFTFLWEQFSTASVTPKSRFSIQKDVMRASGKQFHCLLQSITVISLPQRSRYFIGRTTGSVYTFLVVYSPPQSFVYFDLAVIRIFFLSDYRTHSTMHKDYKATVPLTVWVSIRDICRAKNRVL